jgi:hypothetical protein
MVTRNEIKVGDFIVNNDPRKAGEAKKIVAIWDNGADTYVSYDAGRRRAHVRLDRIYKMGTKGPTNGWTLANSTI